MGAALANAANLSLVGVTVSTNAVASAAGLGGGLAAVGAGSTSLFNTLIAGNSAPTSPDVTGPVNSQGHNLIGDGTGGSGYAPTDLVGTSDNPIDPMLGPLADNGGPTQTMALLPGSQAIDAGDNTGAPDYDQRGPGFPRIVNGVIDIGAFEYQGSSQVQSQATKDQVVALPSPAMITGTAPVADLTQKAEQSPGATPAVTVAPGDAGLAAPVAYV